MNQLLPIIRRVRRPLLVEDVPATVVGNVEPVQVNGASRTGVQTTDQGQQTTGPAEAGTTNQDNAQSASIPTE